MKMRKLILPILAAASITLAAAVPAQASPWLPMWKGKREARKDIRYIVDGDPWEMTCWRRSPSAVDCEWTSYGVGEYEGITCDGIIRERLTWSGYVSFSVRRSADCY